VPLRFLISELIGLSPCFEFACRFAIRAGFSQRRRAASGPTWPTLPAAKAAALVATFLTNLDQTLFHYINSFCGQSLALDHIASRLESSQLKGLAFSATFGALWFQRAKLQVRRRETLLLLLVAIVVSLVVARICADLLPFRDRPMFRPDIGYLGRSSD
jgi:hypothetical protein